MDKSLYMLFFIIAVFRIVVLFISKRHEKKLIDTGAKEYGQKVSKLLAILHTLFYFSAFFEGIIKGVKMDVISYIGMFLLLVSFIALIVVIKSLGKYWTVKLVIAENHELNTNWLFKYIKHPNYFLNIIPELVGVALLFHAWITFLVFIVPYSICLYLRIKEENKLLSSL
ncbi:hypothetical protein IGL98_002448 [Enterococcus sp. DIV0840]|uniref:isoprenylcysteine carboxyl methyltransferase family protein n=1 Tax=Enterococcus TaxID=1350 RepID=UPI001A8E9761|nr:MULTISPECIES: isoprenylcysteine carboxylmethyltransferase family protein [Enterococcus]MBO0433990.1 hypothetical protein [Enterococcus sp. DIV0849a]MBO0474826.1 hypothetical protein [Enterococcus ureasiticus]